MTKLYYTSHSKHEFLSDFSNGSYQIHFKRNMPFIYFFYWNHFKEEIIATKMWYNEWFLEKSNNKFREQVVKKVKPAFLDIAAVFQGLH